MSRVFGPTSRARRRVGSCGRAVAAWQPTTSDSLPRRAACSARADSHQPLELGVVADRVEVRVGLDEVQPEPGLQRRPTAAANASAPVLRVCLRRQGVDARRPGTGSAAWCRGAARPWRRGCASSRFPARASSTPRPARAGGVVRVELDRPVQRRDRLVGPVEPLGQDVRLELQPEHRRRVQLQRLLDVGQRAPAGSSASRFSAAGDPAQLVGRGRGAAPRPGRPSAPSVSPSSPRTSRPQEVAPAPGPTRCPARGRRSSAAPGRSPSASSVAGPLDVRLGQVGSSRGPVEVVAGARSKNRSRANASPRLSHAGAKSGRRATHAPKHTAASSCCSRARWAVPRTNHAEKFSGSSWVAAPAGAGARRGAGPGGRAAPRAGSGRGPTRPASASASAREPLAAAGVAAQPGQRRPAARGPPAGSRSPAYRSAAAFHRSRQSELAAPVRRRRSRELACRCATWAIR